MDLEKAEVVIGMKRLFGVLGLEPDADARGGTTACSAKFREVMSASRQDGGERQRRAG
jgi:hypothetical protein